MSSSPTVFISAASIDLRVVRDLLKKAFEAAQFRVLEQGAESLGAPLGTVRDLLVDAIAQSDCIIHLAGTGYGSDASNPFPNYPGFRCSWTQFEYYHGHREGKPVIGLVCSPGLSYFDKDESGDEAERELKQRLQEEHRQRVASGKFDSTPCEGLERTLNDPEVGSIDELLIRVAKAISSLQRKHALLQTPAFENVKGKLEGLRLFYTIPPPKPGFVGREAELNTLRGLADSGGVAITALKGMGGIGKTELAYKLTQEWAPRFPDARLRLDGQGLLGDQAPGAGKLLSQVIQTFHPETKLPDDLDSLRALYQQALGGMKVIILLDNAKDAKQAAPLLPPPGCALIVTARRSFPLANRPPLDLGRLPDDEAAILLREAYPGLTDAEASDLVHLCAGLPLALRIAGTHLMLESLERGRANVAAYLEKLRDGRLATLDASAEDAGEVTVEETLRLGVEQLSKEEQQAWRKLGIFTEDFDEAAANTVAGANGQMLTSFLRRSLLEAVGGDRYKLHDFAAEYSRKLLSGEESDALVMAHARHYTTVGAAADQLFLGGDPLAGLAIFDRDRIQIEAAFAALERLKDDSAAYQLIYLCGAVANVTDLRFHAREQVRIQNSQLKAARQIGYRVAEGWALGNLGTAYFFLGDAQQAIEVHELHLEIACEIGDRREEGRARGNLGNAHSSSGDAPRAIGYYEQSLKIAREIGDGRGQCAALASLGCTYFILGDARRAAGYYEQSLEIARQIGDRRGESVALGGLGNAHSSLDPSDSEHRAIGYFEQRLEIAREIGERNGEGCALGGIGLIFKLSGNTRRAIEYFEQWLDIARETGDRRGESSALGSIGNAHASLGDERLAIGYYEESLEIARETGERDSEARGLVNLAISLKKVGEDRDAIARLETAGAIFKEIEHPNARRAAEILEKWISSPSEPYPPIAKISPEVPPYGDSPPP